MLTLPLSAEDIKQMELQTDEGEIRPPTCPTFTQSTDQQIFGAWLDHVSLIDN
jgi:hypothetical protein